MDYILDQEFDFDNPLPQRGNYRVKITKSGGKYVECVLKCTRPMQMENYKRQYENGFPVSMQPPEDKTESQLERERVLNHLRAVRKAKEVTRHLVQSMHADRLLTLTYRENVEDREQVKKDFKRFIRFLRYGWKGQPGLGDWKYVAVLEKQQRGAYHIHLAVRGWQPVTLIRKCWYKALGANPDARADDTPGQIDVTSPKNYTGAGRKRQWATDRLAKYIVKYMQKTFDETTSEKNRYWRAKDIDPPEVQRHWLLATNLGDAIRELYRLLELSEGFKLKSHWVSDDQMIYLCDGGVG